MEDTKAVLNVWLCWELCNKLKKEYQPRLSSMCEIFPAIPTILSSATKHSLNRQMEMRHLTQLMRVDLANKRHVFPKQKVWWDLTMTWKTCWAAWRTRWQTCWWRRPLGVAGWLDAAAHLPKYICQFGQIQFEIQTNTIWNSDKYNLKFKLSTIWNSDKYNLKFKQMWFWVAEWLDAAAHM